MTKLKTQKEIAAKKQCFLCCIFGADFANKTADDFARKAWGDMNIRGRFYDAEAPKGDRINLREFAQGEAVRIAGEVPPRDDGRFPYKGKSEAAKKAADMLAKSGVSTAHIGRIVKLQQAIRRKHSGSLDGSIMTFGRAQKLLNMYLKYMWCADKMSEAPHCPFDDIIIGLLWKNNGDFWNSLGGLKHLERQPEHEHIRRWTKSNSVENYLVWLAAANEMARRGKHKSIAEWELFAFEGE